MSAEQFANEIAHEIVIESSSYETISFKMAEFVKSTISNS